MHLFTKQRVKSYDKMIHLRIKETAVFSEFRAEKLHEFMEISDGIRAAKNPS